MAALKTVLYLECRSVHDESFQLDSFPCGGEQPGDKRCAEIDEIHRDTGDALLKETNSGEREDIDSVEKEDIDSVDKEDTAAAATQKAMIYLAAVTYQQELMYSGTEDASAALQEQVCGVELSDKKVKLLLIYYETRITLTYYMGFFTVTSRKGLYSHDVDGFHGIFSVFKWSNWTHVVIFCIFSSVMG